MSTSGGRRPSSKKPAARKRGDKGRPNPARAEAICFGRTAAVSALALLAACILGWLRVLGTEYLSGSDLPAVLGLIALSWIFFAFFLVLPTAFAVVFLRKLMMRSRWHAYAVMAGLTLVWLAILSLLAQAFASVQTIVDVVSLVWPSMLLVAVVCILAAPWMVRDPSVDPHVH